MHHLEQIERLVDHNIDSIKNETNFTRSSFYDDSEETRKLIKSFYKSFDKNNKFIDPFFNPLQGLDSSVFLQRISDYDLSFTINITPSQYLGTEFNFTLINDTSVNYSLYWIDYSGKASKWKELPAGSTVVQNSFLGNVWTLSTGQLSHVFELGKYQFANNNCQVKVSQYPNPYKINIESYIARREDSIIIDPTDLEKYNAQQGRIGNCWFLQSIISLYAMYPEKIVSAFLMPEYVETTGAVALRLWAGDSKSWRLVILDDFLPRASQEYWYCSSPSGVLKNRFWVSLLEKAVAKHVGGFYNLTANICTFSVEEVHRIILGPDMIGFEVVQIPENDSNFEPFDKLLENYKKKNVCSFSSRSSNNGQLIDDVTKMVDFHGYGLLEIRENVAGSGRTMVKCQNPWSAGGEWAGDWGDSSHLWNSYPEISKELKFENKDDGTFWIEKKDFYKAFSLIWIAKVVN